MKKIVLIMLSPVVLLLLLLLLTPQHFAQSNADRASKAITYMETDLAGGFDTDEVSTPPAYAAHAQPLVSYALTLMGTPYVWAGTTPAGFDCSGFITHVYDRFDVQLPHSSRMQAEEGVQVDLEEARPGDLVIFTGTNPQVREPGHVGIVISEPGDTVSFVHSSSNGGVKISQVEGSGYEQRFLQVRRVL